jgi:2'-5' RNA ligase
MEKKFAYVELIFYENAKGYFKKVVKDVVTKDQLYYSDVVSRISGDVTDKIHFTLFYGLAESVLDNTKLKEFIKDTQIEELKLKQLVLFEGYQNLYKVLCVEVDDEDRMLKGVSQKMLDFEHDEELGKREFKPHITIAYVQPDYELPTDYSIKEDTVSIKKIRLSI